MAAPGTGTAAAYEQHVNFSVALAFAQFVHATGDVRFLRDRAWPVLAEVADWIASRVTRIGRGYEIQRTMGIAERKDPSDNVTYVNMGATLTLREAITAAQSLDLSPPATWGEIAGALVLPVDPQTQVILDHDGYRRDEEKGATPGALAGLFPLGYAVSPDVERATIEFYLKVAQEYLGSPMLSALYGVWAARLGDRTGAARLFENGYAAFVSERFLNTHEYREDVYPDQPVAGPFTANLAGFLTSCLYGLPGLKLGPGAPASWCERPVVLPEGWEEISVERLWVRGEPMRLVARHGDERAQLEPAV